MRFFFLFFFFWSCAGEKTTSPIHQKEETTNRVTSPALQTILDSADLKGAILIFDPTNDTYISNDFTWSEKGQLPASTFKIPNSMIALETDVVANDSTLFKWDGKKRAFKVWEQDLIFRNAFKYSCVPCYQEIARGIGVDRMKEYISILKYGQIQVDSTSIDNFWLIGSSTITPFQEIDFLQRFYRSELPISKRTEKLVKSIMVLDVNSNYKLSGKTGWTMDNDKNNGWFVGYVEIKNKLYYFATNIEPNPAFDMKLFPGIRKKVTYQALRELKLIN